MTRTTELLKGCNQHLVIYKPFVEPENCGTKVWEETEYQDGCHTHKDQIEVLLLCDYCKSELRGRLDALKEEVENLQKLGLIKIKRCSCFEHELMNDTYDLVYKRLASIQEEIKLIENGI